MRHRNSFLEDVVNVLAVVVHGYLQNLDTAWELEELDKLEKKEAKLRAKKEKRKAKEARKKPKSVVLPRAALITRSKGSRLWSWMRSLIQWQKKIK